MKKRLTAILLLICMLVTTACGSTGNDSTADLKWWQKTNVYEIYVNSFQDTDGDGYGDLNGITQHLDYLKELGVGAAWLTPVFASPMADNGYDVADYYSINPLYGDNNDMDKLLKEAKDRGIKIVMDLVFNHTSNECEWFVESEKSKDNKYSDWYIWRDAKPDGSEPNNWRSIFGGSAWTWSESRGQYYLHTFAAVQPDLNWENEEVRQALYDVANYWADKGCGGFRMDAIPYIKKPADFSDGTPDDQDGMVSIHDMTANTDGILDYLHEFKEKVQTGRDIFTVGEANGVPASELHNWVGINGVFDMIFEFSHVNLEFDGAEVWCKAKDWKLTDLKKALTDSQAATATNGWYPIFFENHDKPRSINHYFPEDADPVLAGRAMGTILLTLRGTPFLFEGEELGYKNIAWPSINDYDDLNSFGQFETAVEEGLSDEEAMQCVYRFSRDNARTPMQWNSGENAGFTTGTPWLPIHEDYKTGNAESEAADQQSVLSWYHQLAKFRQGNQILVDGDYKEIMSDSEQVYSFVRQSGDKKFIVAVNFTGEAATLDLSEAGVTDPSEANVALSSYTDLGQPVTNAGELRPYEAVVIDVN
ncbi:MAG: alpha-glucosidase [Eubacterium sp.]|nr:alpha-glucosidase [Eubacterium sp.]